MPRALHFKRVRMLSTLQGGTARARGAYPRAATTLDALQAALAAECLRQTALLQTTREARAARYKHQAWRLKQQGMELEAEVQRHRPATSMGGRVPQEWLLRVFLAAPPASAWALAHSSRAVDGTDDCAASRPTISKIRDAWVGNVHMHGIRVCSCCCSCALCISR